MKTIGEKAADTIILEKMMLELAVGQELTYEAMSKALGRDVRKHCAGNIQSAKRAAESQGVILGPVRGVGYQRLNDAGIVKTAQSATKSIGRKARRNIKRLGTVRFETLTHDEKRQHTTAAAQLGATAHFASASAGKKIEAKVNGSPVIALGETLKLFTD